MSDIHYKPEAKNLNDISSLFEPIKSPSRMIRETVVAACENAAPSINYPRSSRTTKATRSLRSTGSAKN